MKKVKLTLEEILVYSKKSGSTLRFRLDERGDLLVSLQDIEVKVLGLASGLETDADVG